LFRTTRYTIDEMQGARGKEKKEPIFGNLFPYRQKKEGEGVSHPASKEWRSQKLEGQPRF